LAILILLGLNFLVIEPLSKQAGNLREVTGRLEQDLDEMRVLAEEYKTLAKRQEQIEARVEAREQGFAPFSYLETLARQAGLGDEIESMTPVTSLGDEAGKTEEIELRLSGIGLDKLVGFLYRIETSDKVLFVNNLHIRPRYLEPERLDVTLRIATPTAS